MNEEDRSNIWSQYRSAKNRAFHADELQPEEKLTLEQLEAQIAETAASSGIPETGLPPRTVIHPSQQRQLSRWFYRILLLLFAGLVVGLFWWGARQHGTF